MFCHNPAYLIPQNCPGEITFLFVLRLHTQVSLIEEGDREGLSQTVGHKDTPTSVPAARVVQRGGF